jgi:hypothetical protein
MVKSFRDDYPNIRNEYSRDHNFAVDLISLAIKDSSGNPDTIRLCSGMIDIEYQSNTYTAQGEFLGYSAIKEDYDVKVGRVTVTLSGLDNNFISKFTGVDQVGAEVVVSKVFLDLNTLDVVSNYAIIMYKGEIVNTSIQESAETATINIESASVFADFERLAGRKTTDWSNWYFQSTQYDTAFEKAGFVGNTEFLWGRDE